MSILLIPVINGILPRPCGGRAIGGFVEGLPEKTPQLEAGESVFICPLIPGDGSLYRIGVLAKVVDLRRQMLDMPGNEAIPFMSMMIEGVAHARWETLATGFSLSLEVQTIIRP